MQTLKPKIYIDEIYYTKSGLHAFQMCKITIFRAQQVFAENITKETKSLKYQEETIEHP